MINKLDLILLAEKESKNPLLPESYDIVYSLIALIVVFVVFWKFVLPKYQKVMKERSDQIEGGIAKAQRAQAEANENLKQYKAELQKAADEAKAIREEAQNDGKKLIEQMKSSGEAESKRIIENANKQLEAQKNQIVNELKGDLGATASKLAEKIVGDTLAKDVKKSTLIDDYLKDLDQMESN